MNASPLASSKPLATQWCQWRPHKEHGLTPQPSSDEALLYLHIRVVREVLVDSQDFLHHLSTMRLLPLRYQWRPSGSWTFNPLTKMRRLCLKCHLILNDKNWTCTPTWPKWGNWSGVREDHCCNRCQLQQVSVATDDLNIIQSFVT